MLIPKLDTTPSSCLVRRVSGAIVIYSLLDNKAHVRFKRQTFSCLMIQEQMMSEKEDNQWLYEYLHVL